MNWYLFLAALFTFFACIGHFTMGVKSFLKPVLEAEIDEIPKKVMHSLFHYMSAYMVISFVVLLMLAFNCPACFKGSSEVALFIGISYAGFAVAQLFVAATSSIKNGVFKLFQWVFWALIAVLSVIGSMSL